ncbi:hypothetical protein ACFWPK_34455 [Nocardia sp. NPDC058519]|uniref:hypothetical protein n=1 Tax=Nocardia sp. NPDC058519 TaxID=3346535 RepID=UPI00364AC5A3
MKIHIEPGAALDALAQHIDQQRAALLNADDRHTEELQHARAEAHILREKLIEAEQDVDRLATALGEANAARIEILAALAAVQNGVPADPGYLDTLPDGSAVIDQHGVMWQRWTTPGLSTRWWAHAPTLANPSGGQWSEGSGRWTSAALTAQRGPVRVIHIPAPEGGKA